MFRDHRVKLTVAFPYGTSREVIMDRLMLLQEGSLTFPQARVVLENWDLQDVPEAVAA